MVTTMKTGYLQMKTATISLSLFKGEIFGYVASSLTNEPNGLSVLLRTDQVAREN